MMSFVTRICVSVLLSIASYASHGFAAVHEKRDDLSSFNRSRLDHNAIIPMRIALRQNNLDMGYDGLMDISDPDSINYGKHWTLQQVHEFFQPHEASEGVVIEWLRDSGIDTTDISRYHNKGWLAIDLSVAEVERLLSTKYYEHDVLGTTHLGCDDYSLPDHVSAHVDFIKPGVALSGPVTKRTLTRRATTPGHSYPRRNNDVSTDIDADLSKCGTNITIPCIRALYNIPRATHCHAGNALGIYESGDKFAQADLNLFFKKYAPYIPQGTTPTVDSIDGGNAPVRPDNRLNGFESALDLQLAYPLLYPQEIVVYQVDDDPNSAGRMAKFPHGMFNTFLDAVDGSYCNYTAYGKL